MFTDQDIVYLAIPIRFHSSRINYGTFEISHRRFENISMIEAMTTRSAAKSHLHTPQMNRRPGDATLLPHNLFQHGAAYPSHRILWKAEEYSKLLHHLDRWRTRKLAELQFVSIAVRLIFPRNSVRRHQISDQLLKNF